DDVVLVGVADQPEARGRDKPPLAERRAPADRSDAAHAKSAALLLVRQGGVDPLREHRDRNPARTKVGGQPFGVALDAAHHRSEVGRENEDASSHRASTVRRRRRQYAVRNRSYASLPMRTSGWRARSSRTMRPALWSSALSGTLRIRAVSARSRPSAGSIARRPRTDFQYVRPWPEACSTNSCSGSWISRQGRMASSVRHW